MQLGQSLAFWRLREERIKLLLQRRDVVEPVRKSNPVWHSIMLSFRVFKEEQPNNVRVHTLRADDQQSQRKTDIEIDIDHREIRE